MTLAEPLLAELESGGEGAVRLFRKPEIAIDPAHRTEQLGLHLGLPFELIGDPLRRFVEQRPSGHLPPPRP